MGSDSIRLLVMAVLLVIGTFISPANMALADVSEAPETPLTSAPEKATPGVESESTDDVNDRAADAPVRNVPEITGYSPAEAPLDSSVLSEDPLDPAETAATMAVIGKGAEAETDADTTETRDASMPASELSARELPFGKGEMSLAVGLGGYGSDGFTLTAGAIFDYYVIDRLAPGMDITYQATFGDVKHPQDLSLFPYLKYILIRSNRIAPYLLAGGGRSLEWGGAARELNARTGEFYGYAPVGSWFTGMGGGIIIGVGMRLRIQVQLLAMYRISDEEIWTDAPDVEAVTVRDAAGNPIATTYRLSGEKVKRHWYPAPSFWLSFAL
jgi:hypothetical protein